MTSKFAKLLAARFNSLSDGRGTISTRELVQSVFPVIAFHALKGYRQAQVKRPLTEEAIRQLNKLGYVVRPITGVEGMSIEWCDQPWIDDEGVNIKVPCERYLELIDEVRAKHAEDDLCREE